MIEVVCFVVLALIAGSVASEAEKKESVFFAAILLICALACCCFAMYFALEWAVAVKE